MPKLQHITNENRGLPNIGDGTFYDLTLCYDQVFLAGRKDHFVLFFLLGKVQSVDVA